MTAADDVDRRVVEERTHDPRDEVGDAVEEAGVKFKEQAADAALEIDGAAGTVEAKGRTAKASPAKKITAAKKACGDA